MIGLRCVGVSYQTVYRYFAPGTNLPYPREAPAGGPLWGWERQIFGAQRNATFENEFYSIE